MDADTITIRIVPEKKGLFLKHSEYEITSRKQKSTVHRRYSDFVHLHGLMLVRSPFRLIPRLPPKQLMHDALLEERRRGLQRWLHIVAKHPVLGCDGLFTAFISDTSPEHLERLRSLATDQPDERQPRLSESVALPAPDDRGRRLAESRTCMRQMLVAVEQLRQLTERQAARTHDEARDVDRMGEVLRTASRLVCSDSGDSCSDMARGFAEVGELSRRFAEQRHSATAERFAWLADVLVAYGDLRDRWDRVLSVADDGGDVPEATTTTTTVVGSAEQPIRTVDALVRRSAFGLHCVLHETELVQRELKTLPAVMLAFTYEQHQGHAQIARIWSGIVGSEADKLN